MSILFAITKSVKEVFAVVASQIGTAVTFSEDVNGRITVKAPDGTEYYCQNILQLLNLLNQEFGGSFDLENTVVNQYTGEAVIYVLNINTPTSTDTTAGVTASATIDTSTETVSSESTESVDTSATTETAAS